ncbi:MAG: hypothetical protein E4H20_09190 [Spirochaetales bacterium]|nr:MAG: hypothetical protein E4H20_09190 [Spirochaetales bacterium]
MNQDQTKELLVRIEEPKTDFNVIFSGKKSGMVNGLYKPLTKEIIIHNRNFQVDQQLVYTAIHEYAHHLHCERKPYLPGTRAHTNEFWAIFHELLDLAEGKDIYRNIFATEPEFADLTGRIRAILPKNGELMLEFGKLVVEAEALCKRHFVRFEDYIDRAVGVPRTSATAAMKASVYHVPADLGWDAMKLVAGLGKPDARSTAIDAFRAGKSQEAVKAIVKIDKPSDDPRERLDRERSRLEHTINTLQERLSAVEGELAKLDGSDR